jgi:hypothetical protein
MRSKLPALIAVLVTACAAMDPNIYEDTTRIALQDGRCGRAKQLAAPAAEQGQPWAQYRLARVLLECKPTDPMAAIEWMNRAASYHVTTAWERGQDKAGPAGYFDARDPVARSAIFLVTFDQAKGRNKEAWLRLAKARKNFAPSEPLFDQLSQKMAGIEQHISQSTLDSWLLELSSI